jgi:flagellin-like protein
MTYRGRRAISPLIAAVLLVVIVVVLGAAVMNLSKNYFADSKKDVTEQSEQIKCGKDVGMELVIIDNNYQICNATATDTDMASLNFMIVNTGSIDILDAQVRMVGTNGIINNN